MNRLRITNVNRSYQIESGLTEKIGFRERFPVARPRKACMLFKALPSFIKDVENSGDNPFSLTEYADYYSRRFFL